MQIRGFSPSVECVFTQLKVTWSVSCFGLKKLIYVGKEKGYDSVIVTCEDFEIIFYGT